MFRDYGFQQAKYPLDEEHIAVETHWEEERERERKQREVNWVTTKEGINRMNDLLSFCFLIVESLEAFEVCVLAAGGCFPDVYCLAELLARVCASLENSWDQ